IAKEPVHVAPGRGANPTLAAAAALSIIMFVIRTISWRVGPRKVSARALGLNCDGKVTAVSGGEIGGAAARRLRRDGAYHLRHAAAHRRRSRRRLPAPRRAGAAPRRAPAQAHAQGGA